MTRKDPFLEGTFWDKFWRPIRSRALLFTPDVAKPRLITKFLSLSLSLSLSVFQDEIIYPPPPPFLDIRHFLGEGGGGVYFEAPRARNFIPPPFLYTPHPLKGIFRGGGGWACIKFGPVCVLFIVFFFSLFWP